MLPPPPPTLLLGLEEPPLRNGRRADAGKERELGSDDGDGGLRNRNSSDGRESHDFTASGKGELGVVKGLELLAIPFGIQKVFWIVKNWKLL